MDEAGRPVPFVEVFHQGERRGGSIATDAMGRFAFESVAGWQSVNAKHPLVSFGVGATFDLHAHQHTNVAIVLPLDLRPVEVVINTADAGPISVTSYATAVTHLNYYEYGRWGGPTQAVVYLPPGTWAIAPKDEELNALGFASLPAKTVTVPSEHPVHFHAARIVGDGRVPQLLSPSKIGTNFTLQLHSQTAHFYILEETSDWLTWRPLATNYTTAGRAQFTVPSSAGATNRFFRAVWHP